MDYSHNPPLAYHIPNLCALGFRGLGSRTNLDWHEGILARTRGGYLAAVHIRALQSAPLWTLMNERPRGDEELSLTNKVKVKVAAVAKQGGESLQHD